MDIVFKIITLIGAVIGAASAVGIMFGIKDIKNGMDGDDSRTLNKGVEKVIVGGAIIISIAGIAAYVISQLQAIKF